MGRKKLDKPKTVQICVRVTKEQKEIIEMIADYAGVEVSDLVRALLNQLILKFKLGLPIMLPQIEVEQHEANVPISNEEEG